MKLYLLFINSLNEKKKIKIPGLSILQCILILKNKLIIRCSLQKSN